MLTLLHTSPVHVATFDALRDRIAPGASLRHIVREDLLARAMDQGITPEIAAETTDLINSVQTPVLCTCTTLGTVAENAGATRIDRPMMRMAAERGGPVLMAYCLESTVEPSLSLLQEELARAGNPHPITPLFLPDAWPLFQSGNRTGFAHHIADAIRDRVNSEDLCVILAQASMADAADHLGELSNPVLSSPETALKRAVGIS
ncbi:hypothetical protein RXV86_10510 [Alisedimentitalea sp. MJ-SS2]|uniref:hypothetical protein n=1 Tax=Aliisedimentitalea sp. MJ-SS2 TaxID=3049795 RepID=UPI00291143B9|nr:hypothetical protein [Alisedimentitalea sp. MJ-SS2]MDU8927815.1 hypothetical protein [Alisedimentitalea sp. MJ-SS2]